jgi:hypothetical protein
MDRRRLGMLVLLGILMAGSACGGGAPASRPSGGGEAAAGRGGLEGGCGEGEGAVFGRVRFVPRGGRQGAAGAGTGSDDQRLRAAADGRSAFGVYQEGAAGDGSGEHDGGGYAAEGGQPGPDGPGSGGHHRLHPDPQPAPAVKGGWVCPNLVGLGRFVGQLRAVVLRFWDTPGELALAPRTTPRYNEKAVGSRLRGRTPAFGAEGGGSSPPSPERRGPAARPGLFL